MEGRGEVVKLSEEELGEVGGAEGEGRGAYMPLRGPTFSQEVWHQYMFV